MSAVEKVGGATRGAWLTNAQVAAYRSLAKSRGVACGDVVEAAANDDLGRIVELRDHAKERRIQDGHIRRIEHLYRSKVLGLWLERDLWLQEQGLR